MRLATHFKFDVDNLVPSIFLEKSLFIKKFDDKLVKLSVLCAAGVREASRHSLPFTRLGPHLTKLRWVLCANSNANGAIWAFWL